MRHAARRCRQRRCQHHGQCRQGIGRRPPNDSRCRDALRPSCEANGLTLRPVAARRRPVTPFSFAETVSIPVFDITNCFALSSVHPLDASSRLRKTSCGVRKELRRRATPFFKLPRAFHRPARDFRTALTRNRGRSRDVRPSAPSIRLCRAPIQRRRPGQSAGPHGNLPVL